MILKIDDHIKMDYLQDKFEECFPHYKIAFFKGQHALKTQNPAAGDFTIGDISKKHRSGEIIIKSSETAATIKHHFKSQFGLLVQLYQLHNGEYIPLQEHQQLHEERSSFTNSQMAIDNKDQSDIGEEEVVWSV